MPDESPVRSRKSFIYRGVKEEKLQNSRKLCEFYMVMPILFH